MSSGESDITSRSIITAPHLHIMDMECKAIKPVEAVEINGKKAVSLH